MNEYTIRPWRPEDRPALKALWREGFGDDDSLIDSFFAAFLKPGSCLVAEADGAVVSAMHIIAPQTLTLGRRGVMRAGYTYALATLPAWRGRGIGGAVYAACCERVLETADAACVLPAEPSLYPLYEKANGAAPLSFLREARFTRDELLALPSGNAARFPGDRYGGLRENLLIGLPHATFDADLFDWMEENGAEFFVLENGLAAAETSDGVCLIHELLVPSGSPDAAMNAVARWCPAREYIVRTPVFFDGPGEIRPGVLGVLGNPPARRMPDDLWWGFGLE